MKLTQIRYTNVKGATGVLDLDAITILVGKNFKGKTLQLEAIRLLLLGFLPELGKTARATFDLSSGREMIVEGDFADGTTISRRWFLKGDSVKTETKLNGIMELNEKGEEPHAAKFAVMMDADVYFSLSGPARVEYVFGMIAGLGEKYTKDKIEEELANELSHDIDLDGKALQRLGDNMMQACRAFEQEHEVDEWVPQVYLEWADGFCSEQEKEAKVRSSVFDKTIQGLAHLRSQEAVDVDAAAQDKERNELSRQLSAAQQEKGRIAEAVSRVRTQKARKELLLVEVRAKASLASRKQMACAKIAEIEEAIKLREVPTEEAIESLRREEKAASFSVSDTTRQITEVKKQLADLVFERREIDGKVSCPYCGASGEGWKALRFAEIDSAIAGLQTKFGQLVTMLPRVAAVVPRVNVMIADAKAKRMALDADQYALNQCKTDRDAIEKTLAVIEAKESELATLPSEFEDFGNALAAANEKVDEINAKLCAVEEARRNADGRKHDLKRLAESEKGRDAAKADQAAAKEASKALRKVKARMVADAFAPILEIANRFCAPLLPSPLAYHDGEIGTWRDSWISHATFSGTEKALAYAAIQIALANKAPVRLMMIDELGRLDTETATALVGVLHDAIESGVIDQFVGADSRNVGYGAAGQSISARLTEIFVK